MIHYHKQWNFCVTHRCFSQFIDISYPTLTSKPIVIVCDLPNKDIWDTSLKTFLLKWNYKLVYLFKKIFSSGLHIVFDNTKEIKRLFIEYYCLQTPVSMWCHNPQRQCGVILWSHKDVTWFAESCTNSHAVKSQGDDHIAALVVHIALAWF